VSVRPLTARRAASALAVTVLMLSGVGVVTWLRIWLAGRHPQLARADAIVIFGAALHATGPSPTLRLRTLHAAELYRRGLAPIVVCSGAVGETGSEPVAMAALLRERGVPEDALVLDEHGVTTRATIANLVSLGGGAWRTVLAVSSTFHVYRIVEEAERHGITALRAPARRGPAPDLASALGLLRFDLRQYAREVVAVWAYRCTAGRAWIVGETERRDPREVRA
jgi:uncharacterized SAM-binding protein YcdF (DUF218 family)